MKSGSLVFEMKVFMDIEGRVFEDMEPEVAGVSFSTELKVVIANEFVVNLNLDDVLFSLTHANIIFNCGI